MYVYWTCLNTSLGNKLVRNVFYTYVYSSIRRTKLCNKCKDRDRQNKNTIRTQIVTIVPILCTLRAFSANCVDVFNSQYRLKCIQNLITSRQVLIVFIPFMHTNTLCLFLPCDARSVKPVLLSYVVRPSVCL